MARYATLDVGSNSVLIYIAEKDDAGNFKTLEDRATITKLGEDLKETGVLKPETMDRTIDALKEFKTLMDKYNVDDYAAIGTMALREAKNAKEFLERVEKEVGLKIEVIPGEEEAKLSHLAVVLGLGIKDEDVAIFDIGGGSTEFIFSKGPQIQDKFSLNIGALVLTNKFLKSDPVKREEHDKLLSYLKEEFAKVEFPERINRAIGMGGNVTSITAVKFKMEKYDPNKVQGAVVTKEEVKNQIDLYLSKTIEERKSIIGLQPKRAETILAGATILYAILDRLGMDSFVVSDRGIRHGLMFARFSQK